MLKEAGYDEFLAEKIRLGCEAIERGEVYTLEQAKEKIYASIERKAAELEQFERECLIYG